MNENAAFSESGSFLAFLAANLAFWHQYHNIFWQLSIILARFLDLQG